MTLNRASVSLRLLPSIDGLLRTPLARSLDERIGREHLTQLARRVIDELRVEMNSVDEVQNPDVNDFENQREKLLTQAAQKLTIAVESEEDRALRRVINATGVVLHTNLGRAPLSEAACRRVAEEAAGYCTLEFDLNTGERGRRGAHLEDLLVQLTGAEAAMIVNNCAAAALLVLTALAHDGETIISRGELVEIGGDFRIPDVMRQSGTRMVEVGTTNRTRTRDYEGAITGETRLICRVHPSNYRIVGFTAAPSLAEIAGVAHGRDLPLYEDAGSGALFDFSSYSLEDEPVIRESIAQGADIVSFSGDKLLGGAQAGLIVGRGALVECLRRNPLARALRPDKLVLAALEATLEAHARGTALREVPALRMITLPLAEIERRARSFAERVSAHFADDVMQCEVIKGRSAIGGGSAPMTHPPTMLVALAHAEFSASELQDALRRKGRLPVIARILDNRLVLDLRTIGEDEDDELFDALCNL